MFSLAFQLCVCQDMDVPEATSIEEKKHGGQEEGNSVLHGSEVKYWADIFPLNNTTFSLKRNENRPDLTLVSLRETFRKP